MTRPARLLVIDPSVAYPEDEAVETILSGWPGEHRVCLPALRPGDGPAPGFGYELDAIVLLGSRASVHDDLPWLRELAAWLDPVLEGQQVVPLLGICFGHQLLAHRAGARVGYLRPDRSSELGIKSTRFDGSRLVPGARELHVVASHNEEVKTTPAGYRVVARRDCVELDGLEHERLPLFGYQFHPEARAGFLEARSLERSPLFASMVAETDALLRAFLQLALRPTFQKQP